MSTQAEELARVYKQIAGSIRRFAEAHPQSTFHVEELRQYVLDEYPTIAPDSPGRILRQMRQDGVLNYVVINRRQSLYQFRTVVPPNPWVDHHAPQRSRAETGLPSSLHDILQRKI